MDDATRRVVREVPRRRVREGDELARGGFESISRRGGRGENGGEIGVGRLINRDRREDVKELFEGLELRLVARSNVLRYWLVLSRLRDL